MPASAPLDLFISHSSLDHDLVAPLVDLLQDALGLDPDRIRASSIDGYRLPAGIRFEEALRRETHDARTFIGVISPASLKSAYVAFELGSRWGADRHLAPLLTPEVVASALQGPLATLNSLKIDDRAQMQQLVADLATELKVTARAPHHYARQLEQLLSACAHRSQAPQPEQAPQHAAAKAESAVDYRGLVEQFDMLMAVQQQLMDQPRSNADSCLEKIDTHHDAVKTWLRTNRLRAEAEITKDADLLLGMLFDERSAFLRHVSIGFAEKPQEVFERLVGRVRSEARGP